MTTAPAIGQPAPGVSLPNADGTTLALADLKGQPVVLYFFPKADTGTCLKQAQALTALAPQFAAADAQVIGISKDSVKKQTRFREKNALEVTFLSDEGADTVERFGVWVEKSMYGKAYMGIERSTFLIAADGTIARIWRNVKVDGHAQEVLDAVRAL